MAAAINQFGLLPIEMLAYRRGSLTKLSGVLPNSVLHLLVGALLLYGAVS